MEGLRRVELCERIYSFIPLTMKLSELPNGNNLNVRKLKMTHCRLDCPELAVLEHPEHAAKDKNMQVMLLHSPVGSSQKSIPIK